MAQGWTSWGVVGRYVRIINTKSSPSFSPARTQSTDPWEELMCVSNLQLSWLPWCTFLSSPAFHSAQYELLWWPQIFQPRWTHMSGPFCCFLQLSPSHASHLLQQFFLCTPWWWEVPFLWDSKTGPQGGSMYEGESTPASGFAVPSDSQPDSPDQTGTLQWPHRFVVFPWELLVVTSLWVGKEREAHSEPDLK